MAGCTAVPLVKKVLLKRGESVLVNRASGVVETMVIQLARAVVGGSGRVAAICLGRNKEMVRKLGAHEVSRSDLYAGVVVLGFGDGYIALAR